MYPVIAMDFETANFGAESACALSLVKIENDQITNERNFLIKPPNKNFRFTYLHGIHWRDVENSPTFGECYDEICGFLEGAQFFAAHNAPFDRGVLRACCDYWGLEFPRRPFLCTLKGARKFLRLPKNSLDFVCSHLKIPLLHHNAASDARAAARILIHLSSIGVAHSEIQI